MESLKFGNNPWTLHRCEEAALALCIAVNVPVIIWGLPGVGKTQVIKHISRAYDMFLVTSILSASDTTDIQGYPTLENGVSKLAPRKWVQDVIDASRGLLIDPETGEPDGRKRHSLVFWDEISTAPPSNQAPALTVILDRLAGDTQMPMTTRMIGAANPPEIAANGWDLAAPMANRFTHLDWNVDVETAVRGFQTGWEAPAIPVLPRNLPKHIRNAKIVIGSFLKKNPTAIQHDFSKWGGNASQNFRASQNAFPSLRAWDTVSKLYAAAKTAQYEGKPLDSEVMRMLIAGTVGDAMATQFLQYVSSFDLQDPAKVLQNPSTSEVPSRLDYLSATLASIQMLAMSYQRSDKYAKIWEAWGEYLGRVIDDGLGDAAFPYIKTWWEGIPDNHAPSSATIAKIKPFTDQFGN